MPYGIIWSPKSKEGIKDLTPDMARRILKKVTELELAPYHFVEKVIDSNCWKARVGVYCVLLDVNEKEKRIEVLKVGHRKNIYKENI